MQAGIKNEYDFKNLIDGKQVKSLPTNLQNLLYALFNNIEDDSFISCWCSKFVEKSDIKIRINEEIKGISIKTGINCSVHQEHIDKFKQFLIKIGVDNTIIMEFNSFIEGIVNGNRVDSITYIKANSESINIIKNTFNDYYTKINLLIRFLFQGTEIHRYDCDAIIYGTPSNFIWGTKSEILKYLIEYSPKDSVYINLSALYIKCYDRNLKNNPQKIERQKNIQVKWYTIKEDLGQITKIRNNFVNNKIQIFYNKNNNKHNPKIKID